MKRRKHIDNHARGWRGVHKPTPVSLPGWLKLIRRLNLMARNWGWSLALLLVPGMVLANDRPEDILCESVDVLHRNHFYDEQGRLVFEQIVFLDWCDVNERHNCQAWRLVKNPAQIPYRDWERGGYSALWQDGEVIRRVHARTYVESWTQYDPELLDRAVLPKESRRELLELKP